ncbi:major facilitator superfamily domain-containing protein [Staphylotrichum tortipilum]|uniref:Major facilitator superfamily domain-containing protein n=1 Tax=Staphylotrichum tortipilum TaxID=2831512 RepID=A0AAN6RQ85_9PEZI|nr:major facilitator superfamily domain-containing protein [Staphylotrichum longicolle]
MLFLAALAKLASFTDVFLSGLLVPLIPTILKHEADVPHQQVQIWTSVLISTYGGAFAVVSPLMPLITRQGAGAYALLAAGLVCAALALGLFHMSSDLPLLILARALQGLAAAAITGGSAGLLATASNSGSSCVLSSLTPAFIQSAGMMTAPFVAGLLHDYYGLDAVFYCAYALVALNVLLVLVAELTTPLNPPDGAAVIAPETQPGGYGTMTSGTGSFSRRSSRSISPRSLPSPVSSQPGATTSAAVQIPWSPRLVVALSGYLVVGLIGSALQSVLPLFVQRRFDWSVLASGYLFVPLAAPAAVIGPLAGSLARRVPESARFLTAVGFVACLPAFLRLGQFGEHTAPVRHAFFLTLGGISLATGLCGDPLVEEVTNTLASSDSDPWNTAALAASLPNLANAWGSLAGPLLAGAISWIWGWQTMNLTLSVVASSAGVGSLLFLRGWILRPYPGTRAVRSESHSDEESAPLLANAASTGGLYRQSKAYGSEQDDYYRPRQDSDDDSPHTRSGPDRKSSRSHRRHFSVDNFSVATTTTPGSMDSSTSSVRFQACLETTTTVQGSGSSNVLKRPQTGDSTGERRYVMREAPHGPATDPLLAEGSLYVIDEERDKVTGVERKRGVRRVVVFPEGSAPPELLARRKHHVVAINALDGTAQMVSESTEHHAVHVTEEEVGEEGGETARRYVVVEVVEEGEVEE